MITRIKWKDHPSLGNLELDFTKTDGTPFNTIVLAGDNGTGKTTILNTLAELLNAESVTPFDFIEYEINGISYKIIPDRVNGHVGFHRRINLQNSIAQDIITNRYNGFQQLQEDEKDIRSYGVSYSRAQTGFQTNIIKSTTTEQIDQDKYEIDNNNDYTKIKQMIIDISSQDNADWMNLCKTGQGNDEIKFEEFQKKSRLHRFEEAFNSFFDSITFAGIDETNAQEKQIVFKKHNTTISIDELSTGEKQIVFRGAHLLRNSHNIIGGTVMIDEPELSMHPKWQKKILDYYRKLFTSNGSQTVQMIIATHSSYVIQDALKDQNNALVIVLNDNSGTIQSKKITTPGVLSTITAAETNYLAFDVPTTDYHIELYGELQNKTGLVTVSACDRYIATQPQYNPIIHNLPSQGNRGQSYQTLPTYVRNAIDHPDPINRPYTEEQLKTSIKLLVELCR